MLEEKNTNASCQAPNASPKRLRVLISAYACEPGKGSEPGVGWNFSKEMAKHHDVWVLTRSNNRKVIDGELTENPVEGLHFFYHDLPRWACWWKKGGRGVQLYYYLWQLTAIPKVRKKHAEVGFDLSHHVTFVKYWAPSCLAWLKIPFVWGPVGGAEMTPKALLNTLNAKGKWYEFLKHLASRMGEQDPFVKKTVRRAIRTLASTGDTKERLLKMGVKVVDVQTQIAMTEGEIKPLKATDQVCRFISIGRMIHWKGFILGLKAFSKLESSVSEYWFIGDGPCRRELEAFVREQGLSERVKFYGELNREKVMNVLEKADVLVHPSYHDSAGLVCLEAMALGKPVLCLNTGGPAELVDEECGFRVSVESEDMALIELSEAMGKLSENRQFRTDMGARAQLRVREKFLWDKKVELFAGLYLELTGEFSATTSITASEA